MLLNSDEHFQFCQTSFDGYQRVFKVDFVCYEHQENMAVLEQKEERRETAHW